MAIQFGDENRMWVEGRDHHQAVATDAGWRVSWLAGPPVDRNRAITAMVLASTVNPGLTPADRRWRHVETWAGELGLTAAEAVQRIQHADDRAAQDAEGDAL